MVIDPVTGQPTIQLEKELYCPGHTDVTITVTTVAFDAIFDADDYWGGGDNWEGWTEEAIAWCKLIYDMDWEELYEGVEIAQDVNIGGITASANELEIWNFLMDLTGNAYGAAGLMGNLYAESGLSPTNLQDSYEASLGYDDQSYTNAVDNGTYQNFVHDQAGYGLAQWTYFSRKQALLTLAKGRGTSIGSLDTQLEYLARELNGGSILADLRNASSVREASDIVMIRFENPADQSERAKALRASYCEYYYNKMTLGIAAEGNLTQKQMDVITIAMNAYVLDSDHFSVTPSTEEIFVSQEQDASLFLTITVDEEQEAHQEQLAETFEPEPVPTFTAETAIAETTVPDNSQITADDGFISRIIPTIIFFLAAALVLGQYLYRKFFVKT